MDNFPKLKLERFEGNPIIAPIQDHPWESKATFNPAAIYLGGKVHIIYRAMSENNTSVFGYASSRDGFSIDERLSDPVYSPREIFEQKIKAGENSGAEDPRIVQIDETLYMCYTAFDGLNPPRVALTSIKVPDFLNKNWTWSKPILISPPGISDKDASLFPRKIGGKFVFLHRLDYSDIWMDLVDDLNFTAGKMIKGEVLMKPRTASGHKGKIGLASPPIETEYGWLMLYHGSPVDYTHYHLKAALLDINDPRKVIARTVEPILEPERAYETEGMVNNVVFPCGAAVLNGDLIVYYGAADKVIGAASMNLQKFLSRLVMEPSS